MLLGYIPSMFLYSLHGPVLLLIGDSMLFLALNGAAFNTVLMNSNVSMVDTVLFGASLV